MMLRLLMLEDDALAAELTLHALNSAGVRCTAERVVNARWSDLNGGASEFGPFFRGADSGVLLLPRCRECGKGHWPPRPVCPSCGGDQIEQRGVPARGALYSWTTTYRAPVQGLGWATPYTVAIVTLDLPDLVRMVGRIDGPPEPRALHAGAHVTGHVVRGAGEELPVLLWRLDG